MRILCQLESCMGSPSTPPTKQCWTIPHLGSVLALAFLFLPSHSLNEFLSVSSSGLDHCPAGNQSLEGIPYAEPSFVANLVQVAVNWSSTTKQSSLGTLLHMGTKSLTIKIRYQLLQNNIWFPKSSKTSLMVPNEVIIEEPDILRCWGPYCGFWNSNQLNWIQWGVIWFQAVSGNIHVLSVF